MPLVVLPLQRQACRDLITSATMAFQDTTDMQSQERAKVIWRQLARQFWDKSVADSKKGPNKQKLHGTKTYEWLCGIEHMLKISANASWMDFQVVHEALLAERMEAPCMSICIDQGGDGWSGSNWLLHKQVMLMRLFDSSHRNWNDVRLALAATSTLHMTSLMGILVLNLDHGPYAGWAWWQQLHQGAEELMQVSSMEDESFIQLWPRIDNEIGVEELCDEARASAWKNLPACVAHKNVKVGMCRWFQYTSAVREYLKIWSLSLVVQLCGCSVGTDNRVADPCGSGRCTSTRGG